MTGRLFRWAVLAGVLLHAAPQAWGAATLEAWATPLTLPLWAGAPTTDTPSPDPRCGERVVLIGDCPDGRLFVLAAPTAAPLWIGGSATDDEQPRTYAALRRYLARLRASPELRDPRGSVEVRVLLLASKETRWDRIFWVLRTCALPDVRIDRVSLLCRVRRGMAVCGVGRVDLPVASLQLPPEDLLEDDDPETPPAPPIVRVMMYRYFRNGRVRIKIGSGWPLGSPIEVPSNEPGEPVWRGILEDVERRVGQSLAGMHPEPKETILLLSTPLPDGGATAYGDVVRVAQRLWTAFPLATLRFNGADVPGSTHAHETR